MLDHPVTVLLGSRRNRVAYGLAWPLLVTLLLGVPGLALAALARHNLPVYLTLTGLALTLAVGAFVVQTEVALTTRLRRGRCLDEVLTTGLSRASLVDGVALHSTLTYLRALLPAAALGFGLSLFLPAPWAAPIWLVASTLLFFTVTYLFQALSATGRMRVAILYALWALTLAACAGVCYGQPSATLWGATGLALMTLGARNLAIDRMHSQQTRLRAARAPRQARAGELNPVVLREVQGRWPHSALMMVPAALVCSVGTEHDYVWFLSTLTWVVLVLLAAYRVVGAIASEREHRTLEPLVQTGLTSDEFLSGWLKTAIRPLMPGTVAAAVVLIACLPARELAFQSLGAIAILLAPCVGALLGLWASLKSNSRSQAAATLVPVLLSYAGALLFMWGALVFLPYLAYRQMEHQSWFDTYLRAGSPLLATVVVSAVVALLLKARLRAELAALWLRPCDPQEGSRSYLGRALATLWQPGRLCLVPGVATAVGFFFTGVNGSGGGERLILLGLLIGLGLMCGAAVWLVVWSPVTRLWARVVATHPVQGAMLAGLAGTALAAPVVTLTILIILACRGDVDASSWLPGHEAGLAAAMASWAHSYLNRSR